MLSIRIFSLKGETTLVRWQILAWWPRREWHQQDERPWHPSIFPQRNTSRWTSHSVIGSQRCNCFRISLQSQTLKN